MIKYFKTDEFKLVYEEKENHPYFRCNSCKGIGRALIKNPEGVSPMLIHKDLCSGDREDISYIFGAEEVQAVKEKGQGLVMTRKNLEKFFPELL